MSSDLDPSSESMDKFIEALAKFSKSPQLHEVLLEDGEASGWCRIDNLTENPYISKTVWWQLFNDELKRTRTNNVSFSRSFTEHYIDLEQLQALLTISSYGYKHAVFMNAGLPPITEEYAKELIASDWFTSRIARNWLNSGTAPESVIPILTAMADPGISRGKAVEHRSVRGWANIKLDPAELELTYQQRYGRSNTGRGYFWRGGHDIYWYAGTVTAMTTSKPKRADLTAIAGLNPGTERAVIGKSLCVNDDNFRWVPDGSVDLVLTDPPFNIARDTNFHTYEKNTINSYRFDADKGWDTYTQESFIALMKGWVKEFARVLRPGGSFAVFCADAYVSHLIDALTEVGLNPRRTLTWRKPNAVPINRKTMMMSSCEYVVLGVKGSKATFNSDVLVGESSKFSEVEQVLVADKVAAVVEKYVREALACLPTTEATRSTDVSIAVSKALAAALPDAIKRSQAMYVEEGGTAYLRGCVPNHVSFNSKAGNRIHPTEKPVPLLRYLTALLSNPGDVVLDPFGGSGSTGEAALGLGRKVVIVERDAEFYGKLSSRLKSTPQAEGVPLDTIEGGDLHSEGVV